MAAALAPAYGVESRQNGRPYNEDSYSVDLGIAAGGAAHAFAIFDGHGSAAVADFAAQNVPARLRQALQQRSTQPSSHPAPMQHPAATQPAIEQGVGEAAAQPMHACSTTRPELVGDSAPAARRPTDVSTQQQPLEAAAVRDSIAQAFLEVDGALRGDTVARMSGTTAVLALVLPRQLAFGHAGDSRAILSRGGKVVFTTDDHKPDRPDETARISQAGGKVLWAGGYRVMGALSVSRAIGDHVLQTFGVSAQPEVTIMPRTPGEDDFILLASDGLFDALTSEQAASVAHALLARAEQQGAPRAECAEIIPRVLASLAASRGSCDNITCMFVDLRCELPAGAQPESVRGQPVAQEPQSCSSDGSSSSISSNGSREHSPTPTAASEAVASPTAAKSSAIAAPASEQPTAGATGAGQAAATRPAASGRRPVSAHSMAELRMALKAHAARVEKMQPQIEAAAAQRVAKQAAGRSGSPGAGASPTGAAASAPGKRSWEVAVAQDAPASQAPSSAPAEQAATSCSASEQHQQLAAALVQLLVLAQQQQQQQAAGNLSAQPAAPTTARAPAQHMQWVPQQAVSAQQAQSGLSAPGGSGRLGQVNGQQVAQPAPKLRQFLPEQPPQQGGALSAAVPAYQLSKPALRVPAGQAGMLAAQAASLPMRTMGDLPAALLSGAAAMPASPQTSPTGRLQVTTQIACGLAGGIQQYGWLAWQQPMLHQAIPALGPMQQQTCPAPIAQLAAGQPCQEGSSLKRRRVTTDTQQACSAGAQATSCAFGPCMVPAAACGGRSGELHSWGSITAAAGLLALSAGAGGGA